MNNRKIFVFVFMLLMVSACFAGTGDKPKVPAISSEVQENPAVLTLDRIFTQEEFEETRFGPTRWLAGGKSYTILEDSARKEWEKAKDIASYDTRTGKRSILVKANQLVPAGATQPLEIEDYSWSKDRKHLLIFTNTERVWRSNTRGDYWVLYMKTKKLQKIGGDVQPSTLMFAKFSPGGQQVAYVHQNDIYVQDLTNLKITRLTNDGSATIVNGTFDWVYEEEFSLSDGFRWSPCGKYIAYWQLDTAGVKDFVLIDNTSALYPTLKKFPYPKAGETNSACRVGIVPVSGGETRWVDIPGNPDPRNHYIAYMEWLPLSAQERGKKEVKEPEILIQHLNRLQNTDRLLAASALTGQTRTIFTEQDETWVDVNDVVKWLKDGNDFLWLSERDGWRHVYKVKGRGDKTGQSVLLTPGEFDVISIEGLDEKNGWLYFIASPNDAGQRYLLRTPLDVNGESSDQAEWVTPTRLQGTHSYDISPGGKWAFHTYSTFDVPPTIDLVRLPSHQVVRTLVDNAELKKKVKALNTRPVEFFRIDLGERVVLDAWCLKPPDFDPSKKYPLLFYVYGEPWGQTVTDDWRGKRNLWHRLLAQHGYLVMSVDNRGTAAPRGRAWRKCIYRQVGILAPADQAAAVEVIKKMHYVDPSRIGIWGWSGGGSMSLHAIFRYPGLYRAAMAVAAVPNQRYYDSIYQERYMGLPSDNAPGYKDGSPITYAHNLTGKLLLVHGTGDDNVHFQGCEALINELIKHNKMFSLMIYPNRSHSIREGDNTSRHLYGLLTQFIEENL